MKQTAVEQLGIAFIQWEKDRYDFIKTGKDKPVSYDKFIKPFLEMEKEQIIEAGNSCAFKQHLHSERINKMSMDELEQYDLEPSYTFGEEYYNETFKNK
jgi:hypothetical protein